MPSFTLKSLLLGAGAVSVLAAPAQLARRDAATISQDIKSVNGNLTAMTEETNKYTGGLVQAIPLTTAEGNLEKSIKEASVGAQASEQLDSEDSKSIIAYINSQLEPNIGKVLDALAAKKDQFTKDKLTTKVSEDIATLHKLTDTLGNTLVEKVVSDDQKDAGKQTLVKIDGDFTQATQTWGASEAASGSSRLVLRDASAVIADIKAVNGKLTALTGVVNSWKGGLVSAVPITQAESALEKSINTASSAVGSTASLNSKQSKAIVSFVTSTLEPNIKKVLAALASKKAEFKKVHLTSVVSKDISSLNKATDTLAASLVKKASADQKSAAKAVVAKIDADFKGAVTAWSSK